MKEMKFTVESLGAGSRIDKYIAVKLGEGYSRTYVKFLMESGFVHVNGEEVKPRYIVSEGEEIILEMPPPEASDIEPENIPIDILYEDEWIIVLNKPAGMVVHPGAGNRSGTLVNALLYHCENLADTGDEFRPGIVHRLDKDTSGIMVVAKTDRALRSLAKQFQQRTIKKRYVALVAGRVEMDNGVVDAPLARHAVDRRKMDIEYEGGKEARTVYHVVRRFKNFTVLKLDLETGRTHQIRVHMKHLGYPILGDTTYGGRGKMSRQALHSEALTFTHPDTGKTLEFTVPLPKDMKDFVENARKEEG